MTQWHMILFYNSNDNLRLYNSVKFYRTFCICLRLNIRICDGRNNGQSAIFCKAFSNVYLIIIEINLCRWLNQWWCGRTWQWKLDESDYSDQCGDIPRGSDTPHGTDGPYPIRILAFFEMICWDTDLRQITGKIIVVLVKLFVTRKLMFCRRQLTFFR